MSQQEQGHRGRGGRILVVDDEPRMASNICTALERAGHHCRAVHDGAMALEQVNEERFDVVVTDWRMPGVDGLELLAHLKKSSPSLPVILVTAFADVHSAVRAMKEGAFDYVAKPFDNEELRTIVNRALQIQSLERENRYLRAEARSELPRDAIVAESPKSRELLDLVERIAPSDSAVLIQGESGTGKELIARALHYWSDRVGAPFVAINCAALAEGVLESELFGHEKGAFTGALKRHVGCFERACGGTLFLDEIGEVSADFQAKLLRVVQEKEVTRVGGSEPQHFDVRLVCATNRVLRDEVQHGRFREDLFYRIAVIPLSLPPLRERREDILPLAELFLERYAQRDVRSLALSGPAQQLLVEHRWPGNVRELENTIERAVVLTHSDEILPEDLLLESSSTTLAQGALADGSFETLQQALDRATAEKLQAALAYTDGRRGEAARLLGIERTTLYRLLKRLGLDEE